MPMLLTQAFRLLAWVVGPYSWYKLLVQILSTGFRPMFLAHDSGQVIDLVYWRTTNTLGPGSWLMILAWVIGTGYWLMLLEHIFLGPSVPPPSYILML